MGTTKGIDVNGIAKEFKGKVAQEVAKFVAIETKTVATRAGNRAKLVKGRYGRKTYRYSNTGQLGRAIASRQKGKGFVVSDGGRAFYTKGYHGMYFLVEKRGEREIKKILADTKRYTESLKL